MKRTPRSSRTRHGRAWNTQYTDQRLAGLCTAPILSPLSGRHLKRRAQSGVEDVALHIAPSPGRPVGKDESHEAVPRPPACAVATAGRWAPATDRQPRLCFPFITWTSIVASGRPLLPLRRWTYQPGGDQIVVHDGALAAMRPFGGHTHGPRAAKCVPTRPGFRQSGQSPRDF